MNTTTGRRSAFPAIRPGLWPTLTAVPVFLVLLGLGTWQVQRLHWKQELIADRAAQLLRPPLDIATVTVTEENIGFRRARVVGKFLHRHQMHVVPRTYKGSVGAHVITPLRLDDGSVVLINRGWIPSRPADPARRNAGRVSGRVEIYGIVRTGGRPSYWTPDNRPSQNVWYYVDPPAMLVRTGLSTARSFIIDAGAIANAGGYPLGGQTPTALPNNHLQYAITWYALAAVLAVIYILYHRRRRDEPGK